jgi:predicted PurR-regulated permease PerM
VTQAPVPPDDLPGSGAPAQGTLTLPAKLFTIAIVGVIALIAWWARTALVPYIIAILVIYMLLPVVHWLERVLPKHGLLGKASRPIAAIGSAVLAIGFLLILIGTLLNPIVDQTQEMLTSFSMYWDQIQANNPNFREAYEKYVPDPVQDWIADHIQQIGADLVAGVVSVAAWLLNTTGSAISTVLALVTIPLFIVYYLIDEKSTARTLRTQFPVAWSEDVVAWFRIFDRIFGAYTRGVILEATIVGVITGFGYWAIGVDLFLPLGVVAFVGEIVPILGPWIAFMISFPVILATQPELAIPAMVVFLVIQMLEGWFLAPQIQGNSNDFTNSGTLIILSIGGALGGGLGMILALPAAGLLRALSVYTFMRLQGHSVPSSLAHLSTFRDKDEPTPQPEPSP